MKCAALRFVLILVLGLAAAGCASRRSYPSLPRQFTEIASHYGSECYLIEILPAFAGPSAIRFDFDSAGNLSIQAYDSKGPQPVIKMTGNEAARRLQLFRTFDWNALGEPPALPGDLVTLYPDDTRIILKASTGHVYREATGGWGQTPRLTALFKAVQP